MYRESIVKRDDSQEATAKLWHRSPEAETIVLLRLAANRVLNDANAHLLGEIGPTRQNVVLEIVREMKIWHSLENYAAFICEKSVKRPDIVAKKTPRLNFQAGR